MHTLDDKILYILLGLIFGILFYLLIECHCLEKEIEKFKRHKEM